MERNTVERTIKKKSRHKNRMKNNGQARLVYVLDMNQPSLPTPFYSLLLFISVFMALSTVFHSLNSPDNFVLSHSVLPVLFLPYWSFQLKISLWKSACP